MAKTGKRRWWWRMALAAAMVFLMVGCAKQTLAPPPISDGPLPLDLAIRSLARDLLDPIVRDRGDAREMARIVIEPFFDRDGGEVPAVSRTIERGFMDAVARYPTLSLDRLNSKTVDGADYLITGTIGLDARNGKGGGDPEPTYRVTARVTGLGENPLESESEVRVAGRDIDYTPTPFYRDNPVFLRPDADRTAPAGGRPADIEALITRALITEGESAFDAGDYRLALGLFQRAASRPGGETLRSLAGIYMASWKLDRKDAAEAAFGRIVAFSVERHETLTVKFLFAVNSDEFIRDADLRRQYRLWLRRIGTYFHRTGGCLHVIGHSSRSGTETWNETLSRNRALRIQGLLKPSFPEVMSRSVAIGRGYQDNIIGIGTDDERDALDRRVEIVPVPCETLTASR